MKRQLRLDLGLILILSSVRVEADSNHVVALPLDVVSVAGPSWKRHVIDDSSKGADGVKLGDLNDDGRLDIVTGWEEGGEVRVYLNPGPRRAQEPWPRVTVGEVASPEDAVFADLDGDGRLDVLSCTEGVTRTVYWHRFRGDSQDLLKPDQWSTTAFPATRNAQQWMQALALDLDGQHGPDVVLASKGENASVGWLQSPMRVADPGAWTFHVLRDAGWIMSLIQQDMDGDGDMDILFSDRKGPRTGVFWLENPGTVANRHHAPWREQALGGLGREVMFADIADVNCDGLMDVAVAVKPRDILVCLRKPDGGWSEQVLTLDGTNIGNAKAVKIADVNGDGWPDLLFTCEGATGEREGIVWLERQPHGPWLQRPLGGPAGVKFDLMQTLDLYGDGDLDVITCEERDGLGVIWYENPSPRF
ncbi:MAG: VCBS repeat-containing protein [Verrucomicrobiae bacterium]|nr:VCBS repeat-containing protein [Verrucomicrobiae bacterium]